MLSEEKQKKTDQLYKRVEKLDEEKREVLDIFLLAAEMITVMNNVKKKEERDY